MSPGVPQLDRIVAPGLGLAVILVLAFASPRPYSPGGRPVAVMREEVARGSVVRSARPVMGTVFEISVWAPAGSEPDAAETLGEALDLIVAIERRVSSWDPQSETSAVNRAAAGTPTRIGPELTQLLAASLDWSERTDGAIDITGSPLFELWNHARQTSVLPTDEEIDAARKLVGYRKVRLTEDTVMLAEPGMSIGFGAVGKGFAADRAATFLRGRGFSNFIIDAGGDVVVSGSRGGNPWHIAIRHPRRGEFLAVYGATDCAMATSGDYERFAVIGGVRYSHILDLRTGRPARGLTSVTAIAQSGTDADALATALFVMGADEGLAYVESLPGVECLMVEEGGAVRLSKGLRLAEGRLEMIP